jgi:hypothetical protein
MKKTPRQLGGLVLMALFVSACHLFGATADEASLSQPASEYSKQTEATAVLQTISTPKATPSNETDLIQPENLQYLGAFRLPDDAERPNTFEYGGNAMTFSPAGNPQGANEGFPGSLFVMGHDRMPYGELPDGNQVAEISIPTPLIASDVYSLPMAAFLQPFSDVTQGHFTGLDELPRAGMAFLDTPQTGPLIHIGWGAHFQEESANQPSHGWFSPTLTSPGFQGEWWLADTSLYSVNGYLFTIPSDWASLYTDGMQLAAGRFRDGGWSGMGPALYAYRPWVDDSGTPAPDDSLLPVIPLLQYESSYASEDFSRAMEGYAHPDEWEGGAWLTDANGRSAVIFAGTKAVGEKFWYGWQHPQGNQYPCIETEFVNEFVTCRLLDGTPCPSEDLQGCSGHNDARGWWSTAFSAQIIFYNPDDLANVAAGTLEPWQPQPYAILPIDDHLFLNPDNLEPDALGSGVQRRYRIGDVAFDAENGLLYVLELFAEGAKPVVHVWQLTP